MEKSYDISTYDGKRKMIDDYIQAFKQSHDLSFKAFCDKIELDHQEYRHVLSWYNNQGFSIKDIKQGRNYSCDPDCHTFIRVRPVQPQTTSMLGKVSINFPDGINLTLQETGIEEVITLLHAYKSRYCAEGGVASCSL